MLPANYGMVCVGLLSTIGVGAQSPGSTALFQNENPLPIRLSYSFKELKKNTDDSTYFASRLHYQNTNSRWDSLDISVRARGNFRRKNCFFSPIRIKIKKSDSKGTLFEGNRFLKLVVPCQPPKSYSSLIVKEYLCYQLYESVSPYTFNTRLLDITLTDVSSRQSKNYEVKGFFIEDDDRAARRFDGKVVDDVSIHPLQLHDTSSVTHDFFEYMIANTDWSTTYQHNAKVIQLSSSKKIPVSYDFDMSGLVNAPYATVKEGLNITSVQERVYRGFCRDEQLFRFVRDQYLNAKPAVLSVLDQHKIYFTASDANGMKKYLLEFFSVLENEKQFQEKILKVCRTQ